MEVRRGGVGVPPPLASPPMSPSFMPVSSTVPHPPASHQQQPQPHQQPVKVYKGTAGSVTAITPPAASPPSDERSTIWRGCCNREAWSCGRGGCKARMHTLAAAMLGLLKGFVLFLPVTLFHTFATLIINCIVVWSVFDYGFLLIRLTPRISLTLRVFAFILFPLLVILMFFLLPLLAMLLAIPFGLLYPVWITLEERHQVAFRYILFSSGWYATWHVSQRNMSSYFSFFAVYMPSRVEALIKPHPEGKVYDIHPLGFMGALLLFLFGSLAFAAVLLLLLLIKLLPMVARAYSNHVNSTRAWFKGCNIVMVLAYFLFYAAVPLVAAFAFPLMPLYAFYVGARSFSTCINSGYSLRKGADVFHSAFRHVHDGTNTYIFNANVPFMVLPSKTALHGGWITAGIFPFVFGLIVNLPLMLLVVLVAIAPCTIKSYIEMKRLRSLAKSRPALVIIPYIVLPILIPVLVPLIILARMFGAYIAIFGVFMEMNQARSLAHGFRYVLGLVYRFEYSLNKFAYKLNKTEKVHFASIYKCFMPYGQLCMPAEEFQTASVAPSDVITAAPRYVPRGLRKPKRDAEGRIIDMTGEAWSIPGYGVAPIVHGSVLPAIPLKAGADIAPGASVPDVLVWQPDAHRRIVTPMSPALAALSPHPQTSTALLAAQAAAERGAVGLSDEPTAAPPARRRRRRPCCVCCSANPFESDAEEAATVTIAQERDAHSVAGGSAQAGASEPHAGYHGHQGSQVPVLVIGGDEETHNPIRPSAASPTDVSAAYTALPAADALPSLSPEVVELSPLPTPHHSPATTPADEAARGMLASPAADSDSIVLAPAASTPERAVDGGQRAAPDTSTVGFAPAASDATVRMPDAETANTSTTSPASSSTVDTVSNAPSSSVAVPPVSSTNASPPGVSPTDVSPTGMSLTPSTVGSVAAHGSSASTDATRVVTSKPALTVPSNSSPRADGSSDVATGEPPLATPGSKAHHSVQKAQAAIAAAMAASNALRASRGAPSARAATAAAASTGVPAPVAAAAPSAAVHSMTSSSPARSSPVYAGRTDLGTAASTTIVIDDRDDDEEGGEDEGVTPGSADAAGTDGSFVIMPIVRPGLPDVWEPVERGGKRMYMNKARNQLARQPPKSL